MVGVRECGYNATDWRTGWDTTTSLLDIGGRTGTQVDRSVSRSARLDRQHTTSAVRRQPGLCAVTRQSGRARSHLCDNTAARGWNPPGDQMYIHTVMIRIAPICAAIRQHKLWFSRDLAVQQSRLPVWPHGHTETALHSLSYGHR